MIGHFVPELSVVSNEISELHCFESRRRCAAAMDGPGCHALALICRAAL